MSDQPSSFAALSPEQRRLLELLAHKQATNAAAAEAAPPTNTRSIPRRADGGPAPLSFGQQRLWLLDQFQPGSSFYNMPQVMELDGPLDSAALARSLQAIVQRHAILRTTFAMHDGEPTQVIAPTIALPLAQRSVEDLPAAEREAAALQLVIADAQRPFDLAHGPLVRALLVRLDAQQHMMALVLHHIIFDGWSMGVLLREIAALYHAFVTNAPAPLPELPIQYADYAVWQRDRLQGARLERELAFWKNELDGAVAALELPTDRPRAAGPSFTANGAKQPLHLPRSLAEALTALSKQEGGTLFMALLAAFHTLLHRYTEQPHILVGSPIANRNQDELEAMIGFFNNMLVLHGDLSADPTFRELLQQVRATTLRAYEHQELPFERLVEEFQPSQTMSRSPLFQVMFALQNAPLPVVEQGDLTLRAINVDLGAARFDLSLSIREHEQGLTATLLYNTDLFNADTVTRMLEHYHTLLQNIVAHPDHALGSLALITTAEQEQLLAWSDAAQIYLLDQRRQLVPIGVPGTVYLGDGQTDHAETLGAERDPALAIPHPFRDDLAARLYPTERRARYHADGTLELLTAAHADSADATNEVEFVPPRTPIEEELVVIWQSILGHERIGVNDDFFRLGGHSLSASRLMTRVRETFKVELPLRSLFEATTVAAMAELMLVHETRPGQTEKIARVMQRLRSSSPEEKRHLLEQKRRERSQPSEATE